MRRHRVLILAMLVVIIAARAAMSAQVGESKLSALDS
jgi:hypothetical protein